MGAAIERGQNHVSHFRACVTFKYVKKESIQSVAHGVSLPMETFNS